MDFSVSGMSDEERAEFFGALVSCMLIRLGGQFEISVDELYDAEPFIFENDGETIKFNSMPEGVTKQ